MNIHITTQMNKSNEHLHELLDEHLYLQNTEQAGDELCQAQGKLIWLWLNPCLLWLTGMVWICHFVLIKNLILELGFCYYRRFGLVFFVQFDRFCFACLVLFGSFCARIFCLKNMNFCQKKIGSKKDFVPNKFCSIFFWSKIHFGSKKKLVHKILV